MRDEFFWLNAINRATVVAGVKSGRFERALAEKAAAGIAALEKAGATDPAFRVKTYIAWEPLFVKEAGAEATVIHAGRSSQDILSTKRAAMLREKLLQMEEATDLVIETLLRLAECHRETVVPSYTNGVAAQPTTLAHYLLGIVASILRIREAMAETYGRLNRSAMGAAVLNGTGWPVDREETASLLGFDAPVTNAFDATSLMPVDMPLEVLSHAARLAVRMGSVIDDIMVQYARPRPWILLVEGGVNTYISSAMPQKRNPGLMNNCREACSETAGEMMKCFMRAHNVVPGMIDGKRAAKFVPAMDSALTAIRGFREVLRALTVDPCRALEELNADWTASQEVADRLMRDCGLPFRVGHHVVSRMVSLAREKGFTPLDFPYEEFRRIYGETVEKEYPEGACSLPMSREAFLEALDPKRIVEGRRSAGSAAPAEVERMLCLFGEKAAELSQNRRRRADTIERAMKKLDAEFFALL